MEMPPVIPNYWPLPVIAVEHSEREKALGLPPRQIKRQEFRDRARWNGSQLRFIRAMNGIGSSHVRDQVRAAKKVRGLIDIAHREAA